jgi:hypothetical protein
MVTVLLLLASIAGAEEKPIILEVSPDGPLPTIQAARDRIRARRAQGQWTDLPITVSIRAGTYFLTEPITFDPQDSGKPNAPITYTAYKNEKPIISGGKVINGWQLTKINGQDGWVTNIPEVKQGKWYFHQLWINGQRRFRARHPNEGFTHIESVPDLDPKQPYHKGQKRFIYAPGDIKKWDNLTDVYVVVLHFWVDVHLGIASVDEEKRIVNFVIPSRRRLTDCFTKKPAPYYVENAYELLDAPGEWYLNRNTGQLYYLPMPGEKISQVQVMAPKLDKLLSLEGQPQAGKSVEHLTFKGLTFNHSEWWLPRDDAGDIQAASTVPGAIQGSGMKHCIFNNCTVAHIGSYAMEFGYGSNNNQITKCKLYDLGAGGIKIAGPPQRQPENLNHSNQIINCHIHDGGRTFHQAVGILLQQSSDNRIAHNHIHDFYYTGISVGWVWGYSERSLSHGNIVEFNHVHHLGKGWLSDLAGIYTLGIQPGTVIRNNLFHDIKARTYGGWGIYNDEGSSNILIENNIVYRTTHGGYHQHYGRENIIRNNIFAFARDHQIQRSREEKHKSFTFERNIVYWDRGALLAGKWSNLNFNFDGNLYWFTKHRNINFQKLSFNQWQEKGMDKNSIIANPLFVDPQNANFTLKPNSPALKLGFKPIDTSKIGPIAK